MSFGEHVQSADWKKEKHIPVSKCQKSLRRAKPLIGNGERGQGDPPSQHHRTPHQLD